MKIYTRLTAYLGMDREDGKSYEMKKDSLHYNNQMMFFKEDYFCSKMEEGHRLGTIYENLKYTTSISFDDKIEYSEENLYEYLEFYQRKIDKIRKKISSEIKGILEEILRKKEKDYELRDEDIVQKHYSYINKVYTIDYVRVIDDLYDDYYKGDSLAAICGRGM